MLRSGACLAVAHDGGSPSSDAVEPFEALRSRKLNHSVPGECSDILNYTGQPREAGADCRAPTRRGLPAPNPRGGPPGAWWCRSVVLILSGPTPRRPTMHQWSSLTRLGSRGTLASPPFATIGKRHDAPRRAAAPDPTTPGQLMSTLGANRVHPNERASRPTLRKDGGCGGVVRGPTTGECTRPSPFGGLCTHVTPV